MTIVVHRITSNEGLHPKGSVTQGALADQTSDALNGYALSGETLIDFAGTMSTTAAGAASDPAEPGEASEEAAAGPQHALTVKWQGREFAMTLGDADTVGTLKRRIEEHTEVQPKRQKLLGLKAKKGSGAPADELPMADLALKPGLKIMMMG